MKYILQPDGSIKNIENSSEELSRSEVNKIKNKLSNSIYESSDPKFEISSLKDLPSYESDDRIKKEKVEDYSETFSYKRLKKKKNDNFDFIDSDESEEIYSYSPFNYSSSHYI